MNTKVYLPRVPKGTHLGKASGGFGLVTGLLFSDVGNRLVDHAEWEVRDVRTYLAVGAVVGGVLVAAAKPAVEAAKPAVSRAKEKLAERLSGRHPSDGITPTVEDLSPASDRSARGRRRDAVAMADGQP